MALALGFAVAGALAAAAPAAAAAAPCVTASEVGALGTREANVSNGAGGRFSGTVNWTGTVEAELWSGRISDAASTKSYSVGEIRWHQGYDNCQGGVRWEPEYRYSKLGTAQNGKSVYPVSWSRGAHVKDVHLQVCTYRQVAPVGWTCSSWG
ncbi:hypothetical protein [Lentzea kentuckyensis]|uniref:hypothetical protein n=1 Tax=Lentzea kentuckyensis TaxID=360086 RepID=UPI001302C697|nr:hypothetical protein [Lentzea kentuckyensis]